MYGLHTAQSPCLYCAFILFALQNVFLERCASFFLVALPLPPLSHTPSSATPHIYLSIHNILILCVCILCTTCTTYSTCPRTRPFPHAGPHAFTLSCPHALTPPCRPLQTDLVTEAHKEVQQRMMSGRLQIIKALTRDLGSLNAEQLRERIVELVLTLHEGQQVCVCGCCVC